MHIVVKFRKHTLDICPHINKHDKIVKTNQILKQKPIKDV